MKPILTSTVLSTVLMLTMCGRTNTGVTEQPTPASAVTVAPSALPTPSGELDVPPTPIIVAPTLPVVTPDVYQSYPDYGLIIDYETKVADPSISESLRETYRRNLAQERHAAERRATEIAQMPKTPIIPTLTLTPIGFIEPTPDMPRGILPEVYQDPKLLNPARITCTSMWQDIIDRYAVQVLPCYLNTDPSQLFVVMLTFGVYPPFDRGVPDQYYPLPPSIGLVRITAAQGTLLTLQNDDQSATFYFDAATRQYVNNLGAPVPVTPSPTQVAATPQAALLSRVEYS